MAVCEFFFTQAPRETGLKYHKKRTRFGEFAFDALVE